MPIADQLYPAERASIESRAAGNPHEMHTSVLANLSVVLDHGISRFEPGISPWKYPREWRRANASHVASIIHSFKITTGSDEIGKAEVQVTYPVSADTG